VEIKIPVVLRRPHPGRPPRGWSYSRRHARRRCKGSLAPAGSTKRTTQSVFVRIRRLRHPGSRDPSSQSVATRKRSDCALYEQRHALLLSSLNRNHPANGPATASRSPSPAPVKLRVSRFVDRRDRNRNLGSRGPRFELDRNLTTGHRRLRQRDPRTLTAQFVTDANKCNTPKLDARGASCVARLAAAQRLFEIVTKDC